MENEKDFYMSLYEKEHEQLAEALKKIDELENDGYGCSACKWDYTDLENKLKDAYATIRERDTEIMNLSNKVKELNERIRTIVNASNLVGDMQNSDW